MNINHLSIDNLLLNVLQEDIGTGDITTNSCILENVSSNGNFVFKESGIVCGLPIVRRLFYLLDKQVIITSHFNDSDYVQAGDIVAEIKGNSRSLLSGERTALNLLQRMSGIATKTAIAVKEVSDTNAKITDTRKTVPGLRILDKYAVKCGGGTNHRFNLSDGILIKDNHIRAAGGIKNAVAMARRNSQFTLKIEVETETLKDVEDALESGADIIMLDNMTLEMMKSAVEIINGRALTEASGNMGDRDLRTIALTGVDFISIGALTHSVTALDISLKFE